MKTLYGLKPAAKLKYARGKFNRKTMPPIKEYIFNLPTACAAAHKGFFKQSISEYMIIRTENIEVYYGIIVSQIDKI